MRHAGLVIGRRRRARARKRSGLDGQDSAVKVLYLFPEAWVNSPWSVIMSILQHAEDSGIQPYVVFDDETGGPSGVDESTVPLVRMPLAGRPRLGPILRLRRLVLDHDVDVVHIVDSGPSLRTGAIVSLVSRTPLVIHFHSIPALWGTKKRITMRAISTGAGAVVGVSRFVRDGIEQHIGVDGRTVTHVHNGVDVDRFDPEVDGSSMRTRLGFGADTIALVEPARFWMLKGQLDLVRAVEIARRSDPRIELALIGWNEADDADEATAPTSFRAEVEALIAELDLGGVVRCYEPTADAPGIHAAADIVCLPSIDEPFGLVAIEAQACGRAFVGADSGALPEMIDDGVDGCLVPPNSPEALAATLLRLAGDAGLRAELGRAGRIRARAEFDARLVAPRFAAVYRAVLDGSPLPGRA